MKQQTESVVELEPRLDGPYSREGIMDQSYTTYIEGGKKLKKYQQKQEREQMWQLEQAKKLSTLATQYKKMADQEYDVLEDVMGYNTETNVQGLKQLDACYIKTPYCEESPNPSKVGINYYGLIIACDGYSMRKGLLEFWNMIIQENVRCITSFNESFSRGGAWFEVFKYFPEEIEIKFDIKDTYSIKTVSTTKTKDTVTRILSVCDHLTGMEVHQVKHIHFKVWYDFEVPSKDDTAALINCLQEQATMLTEQIDLMRQGQVKNPQKILMHCLAGRGRTGTAIAIVNTIMTLQGQLTAQQKAVTYDNIMNLQLSVFSIVRRLREQRSTAVQTSEQYQYIYDFILQWATIISQEKGAKLG